MKPVAPSNLGSTMLPAPSALASVLQEEQVPFVEVLYAAHPDDVGALCYLDSLPFERSSPDGEPRPRLTLGRAQPGFSRDGQALTLQDPCLSRYIANISFPPARSGAAPAPQAPLFTVARCARAHPELSLWSAPLHQPQRRSLIGSEPVALPPGSLLGFDQRLLLLLGTEPASAQRHAFGLVGASPASLHIFAQLRKLNSPGTESRSVLLLGETGVGKSCLAGALHQHSSRAARPLVVVAAGTIPTSLEQAELFGIEANVATEVQRRQGALAKAHQSSLFLEEIGDFALSTQLALLSFLDTHRIQAVGAAAQRELDVRILAATNAELDQAIENGSFRRDLYHRLAEQVITIPPLRARPDDAVRLFWHFLRLRRDEAPHLLQAPQKNLPAALPMSLILNIIEYEWSGNVRELHNFVRQLVQANLHASGRQNTHIPSLQSPPTVAQHQDFNTQASSPGRPQASASLSLDHATLHRVLDEHDWNTKRSAEALGIGAKRLIAALSIAGLWPLPKEVVTGALAACGHQPKKAAERLGVALNTFHGWMRAHQLPRSIDLSPQQLQDALAQHQGDQRAAAAALGISLSGLRQRLGQMEPP
ncbi:MAG: sigma 54-interacting transcriptional regulator [Myxococcota bacterium]|nr:sigma 54-interacting transcriptional regulator [Myxococcota bacterium]